MIMSLEEPAIALGTVSAAVAVAISSQFGCKERLIGEGERARLRSSSSSSWVGGSRVVVLMAMAVTALVVVG